VGGEEGPGASRGVQRGVGGGRLRREGVGRGCGGGSAAEREGAAIRGSEGPVRIWVGGGRAAKLGLGSG